MTHTQTTENPAALTPEQLDAYLARLGLDRPARADLASLIMLQRAHLLTFTWEALDAYMGWPVSAAPQAAFAKMVEGRRGGWCYEMNGLFGAALAAIGYKVTRLCGGVNRAQLGEAAIGNHLTLRVDLDRPYLVEAGLADAVMRPVPLALGPFSQRGFDFSIKHADSGWLRFNNHAQGLAPSFDFRLDHSDEAMLEKAHAWLMQDAASPFRNALAVMRHTPDGYVTLQNDRLRRITPATVVEQRITGAAHLAETLETVFDLHVPDATSIWEKVKTTGASLAA